MGIDATVLLDAGGFRVPGEESVDLTVALDAAVGATGARASD